jgi:2-C-methyl-D-erythritol 2,4-cyclodiphosphate synthase
LSEIRTGLGWDVHRLAAGRALILGGVTVPSEMGLEGHSDADVLAHAITDAILGAAALGDIGMHFPDSDPRWKGADSLVFLRHARQTAEAAGFRIVHVDSTVILERPKLKDYRDAIRERLATTLGLTLDRVSLPHFHGQYFILQLCARRRKAAMEVGRPMCRRSVPISTTSSSPFLKSPTSPFRERQPQADFVMAVLLGEGVGRLGAGHRRGIFVAHTERAPVPPAARAPSTSWVNSGTRFTGTGAK